MFMPFERPLLKALSYLVLTVVGFRNTVSQTGIIVENPLSVSYQVSSSRDYNPRRRKLRRLIRLSVLGWRALFGSVQVCTCPYPLTFSVFPERTGFICS